MLLESDHLKRLKDEIVPKIVRALGREDEKYRFDAKVPTDSYFMSTVYMVKLSFSENEVLRLVVKTPGDDEATRLCARTDVLFGNEIVFYKYFGKNYVDYPRCVFAASEPVSMAVIVLEDVCELGYRAMKFGDEIGLERALAAVREIGRLHGRGYVLKENYPEEFFGIVARLGKPRDDHAHPVMIEYTNRVSVRPVKYLRSVNYASVDPEFCDRMESHLGNAYEAILRDCARPRNELAVICHGDFTSNNILFRSNRGVFETKLIDFAQLTYSSPAIDLSTFLYVSCEEEVRDEFDLIFKVYHETVLGHLEEHGVRDLERYSFDAFLRDYKRHVVFGCEVAIFFKPVLHLKEPRGFDYMVKNLSAFVEEVMDSGGDQLSKKLADMLIDLKEEGCLDHMM